MVGLKWNRNKDISDCFVERDRQNDLASEAKYVSLFCDSNYIEAFLAFNVIHNTNLCKFVFFYGFNNLFGDWVMP